MRPRRSMMLVALCACSAAPNMATAIAELQAAALLAAYDKALPSGSHLAPAWPQKLTLSSSLFVVADFLEGLDQEPLYADDIGSAGCCAMLTRLFCCCPTPTQNQVSHCIAEWGQQKLLPGISWWISAILAGQLLVVTRLCSCALPHCLAVHDSSCDSSTACSRVPGMDLDQVLTHHQGKHCIISHLSVVDLQDKGRN